MQQRSRLKRCVSRDQIRSIRRLLVQEATSGRLVDYRTAEQGPLSVVTLPTYLGEDAKLAGTVDALFEGLGNDETFWPPNYASSNPTTGFCCAVTDSMVS